MLAPETSARNTIRIDVRDSVHLGDIQPRIHVRVDVQIAKLPGCINCCALLKA